MKKIFGFLLLSSLITVSCEETRDLEAPVIEVIKPNNLSEFYYGDTIDIKASISDMGGIMMVSYELFADKLGDDKFEFINKIPLDTFYTEFTKTYSIELPSNINENTKYTDSGYSIRLRAYDFNNNISETIIDILIKNKE